MRSRSACLRGAIGAMALLSGSTIAAGAQRAAADTEASRPSQREWQSQALTSQFVTMSDGTRIAVDVILPTGYIGPDAVPTRFPVIFRYMPYRRRAMDVPVGPLPAGQSPNILDGGAAVVDRQGWHDGWLLRRLVATRRSVDAATGAQGHRAEAPWL